VTTTGRGIEVANPTLILSDKGPYCYAFSGEKNPNNSTLTALEFISPDALIDARIYWGVDVIDFDTGKDVGLFIKLNGVLVYEVRGQAHQSGDFVGIIGNVKVDMYIPPSTTVLIEVSTSQTNTVGQTVMLKGVVYG